MPPHPEPDAILINVDENGKRRPSEGGYPGFPGGGPGIFGNPGFGFPRSGRGPEVNNRPDIYGARGHPGVFGIPRLPGFPNTFGMNGFHTISTNVGDPSVYGIPGLTGGPGLFLSPHGPGGSLMSASPNMYGIRVHQNGPGLTARTGVFGGSQQPRDLSAFGHRDVFAVAGSGDFPYHLPGFFFPRRNPDRTDSFPTNRGRMPESEGTQPDVHYPEGSKSPHPTRDSDDHFPKRDFRGGSGGRETYDDPSANMFPLINAPTPVFESA